MCKICQTIPIARRTALNRYVCILFQQCTAPASAINISHAEGLVFHQHQKSYHQMSFKSPEIRHVCQEGQRGTSWQEWGQSRISVYPRGVSARSEPELPTERRPDDQLLACDLARSEPVTTNSYTSSSLGQSIWEDMGL